MRTWSWLKLVVIGASLVGCRGDELEAELEQEYEDKFSKLTRNWTSVRDCPGELYENQIFYYAVNGLPAHEREFAHIAAIGWTEEETGVVDWNCGGSLISENFVLTAAHCTRYRGKQPDVVRLGDLDLQRDDDNENAQQFKIAEVIKHPEYKSNSRYHDLALLRLDGSINVTHNVCPACIWTNPMVNFRSLEACGYGQTGQLEDKSLNLLKVTLSPVSQEECESFYPADRKLKSGLLRQHICAADPEARQDTCMGDSGGPLQIKLLGGSRVHPFIIGVTSFGKGCATATPGVYVRLAEYTDWIQTTTGISLNPHECVHKYDAYREQEPDVLQNKIGGLEYYNLERAHIKINPLPLDYVAQIGWLTAKGGVEWNCGGTFIHHSHVLTSASCLTSKSKESGLQPVKVKNGNSFEEQEFKVEKVVLHPKFVPGQLDHDIALILLDKEVKFSYQLHPICLWVQEDLPEEDLEVVGLASVQVHNSYAYEFPNTPDIHVTILSSRIPEADCSAYHKDTGIAISDNQLCYGNSLYVVPDSCQLDKGGPIVKRQNKIGEGFYPYQYGVNIQGKDCGFSHPTVATRVSRYIDWIDSVIFGGEGVKELGTNQMVFKEDMGPTLDSRSPMGGCVLPDGRRGVCKKSSECMEVVVMVKKGQVLLSDYVCNFSDAKNPMICCPT